MACPDDLTTEHRAKADARNLLSRGSGEPKPRDCHRQVRTPSVEPSSARPHEVGEHKLRGRPADLLTGLLIEPVMNAAKMRAMASSSAACQKPSKCRVTPGSPPGRLQVTATGTSFVPQTSWRARAALAPIVARLPAYAGYGGVVIKGSQVESGRIGIQIMSAARIAVTGRHTPYTNLLACVVWRASWIETFTSTNTRAVSTSDSCARGRHREPRCSTPRRNPWSSRRLTKDAQWSSAPRSARRCRTCRELHLVEIGGVSCARERRRGRWQEVVAESSAIGAACWRWVNVAAALAGGVGCQRPGRAARRKAEKPNDPAVILPPRQDLLATWAPSRRRGGRSRKMINKIGCKGLVIGRHRRRIESHEHVMSSLRGRGRGRSPQPWPQSDPIRFEVALDGVDRIEHRDVHHRVETGCLGIARLR